MPPKSIQSDAFSVYLDGKRIENFSFEPAELTPAVKPIGDLHSVPHFRCGVCQKAIVVYCDGSKPDTCRWCGVKVDWKIH